MIKMKFDEAYQKMKEGKVIMVRDTDVELKFYRIINDIVEVKYGYDGEFVETFIPINTFIQYDFNEENAFTLNFIEAIEHIKNGKTVCSEYSECKYMLKDGKIVMIPRENGLNSNAWFVSKEVSGKWRVME